MNNPDQISLFETIEPPLSLQDSLRTLIRRGHHDDGIPPDILSGEYGRVILMTGVRDLISLGHYLAVRRLIEGEAVVFVDGANIIDLPFVLRLARLLRADPRIFLKQMHLSRAFTAHQLESVIARDLAGAMERFRSRLCIVSGLMDTPTDDELPLWEAGRLLRNITGCLRSLADQGRVILVIAPDPAAASEKTGKLLPIVKKTADRTFQLSRDNDRLVLE